VCSSDLMLLTTSCSVLVDVAGSSAGSNRSIPVNSGPRADLVIDEVRSPYSMGDTRSLIRSSWARNPDLQSWFILVDRVTRGSDTYYLNASVGRYRNESDRIGTPKYGYQTIYRVEATVNFELIDASTGTVVAASIGTGSDTSAGSRADSGAALARAVENGLVRLLRVYAGVA